MLKCCDNLHDVAVVVDAGVVDAGVVDAVVAKAECAGAGNSRKGSSVVVVADSMLGRQCVALNSRHSLKDIQNI